MSSASIQPAAPAALPTWLDRMVAGFQKHGRKVLVAGILLQLLVLVGMIALHMLPLLFGERILLRVRPVDPRDIFRGDYVILSYDFSQLPADSTLRAELPGWRNPEGIYDWADRPVYVSLEPEEDGVHYKPSAYSFQRPAAGRYIKGRVVNRWGNAPLKFGIEAFYVPEGQARELEVRRNANNLSAEIALAPWGQALLCNLK